MINVKTLAALLMALAPPFVTAAYAQAVDQPVTIVAAAGTPITDMTDGEVRKIDKDSQKVTLKHGEIKNLDMPPMTMVFQVSDPALLGKIKVGDKVRFTATQVNGAYTVMSLEPAP